MFNAIEQVSAAEANGGSESILAKKMKLKLTMQYSPRYLSDDILFQILCRLPVKSLLRFTSVSKSWKSFIRSSSFISIHHRHQIANNNNNRTSCSHLVYIEDRLDCVQNCTLIPENSKGARPKISVPLLSSKARVASSCGGLVCLIMNSAIYIWNPFTIRLKKIPDGELPALSLPFRLGFGFATQSGDYRLVKILCDRRKQLTEVEIYSLSSDSWRRIKADYSTTSKGVVSFKEWCSNFSAPLSFKGSIYWFCDLYENNELVYMILRFNLDKEIFEEIINVPITGLHMNLVVANGYLVLFKSQYETMEQIRIRAYINKESESESESESELGSSSWAAKSCALLKMTTKIRHFWTTPSAHIIVKGEDGKFFAYYCHCDGNGNDWSYEIRELGIRKEDYNNNIIPITETLLLLDEK